MTMILAAAPAFAVEERPSVTADDLLDPAVFPDAQFGMAVTQAKDGPTAEVVTTGAVFRIDKLSDTITCRQTIAADRDVAVIRFPKGTLAQLRMEQQTGGLARFSGGGSVVRINGDSLLMVKPASSGDISARLTFRPDYQSDYQNNYNFFDPFGGISFFEHGECAESRVADQSGAVEITWRWDAGDVFWAGVSPPKPYDWEASVRERYVMHGSSVDRFMYPGDLLLKRWSVLIPATVLYLHNENAWEHWQLSFIPKNMDAYLRTMRTAHEFGMKTIVYASPKHLLKGTAGEALAKVDVNDPATTGWNAGSNVHEFMRQATRIIREFETDGLYFDEMYCNHRVLAANYYIARASRELVGPGNPLVFHATEDVMGDREPGSAFGRTSCPTVHAYFNVIYKGEAVWNSQDPAYTRYILSTYNISNAISVQAASDERYNLSPEQVDFVVTRGNTRLFVPEHFYFTGQIEVYRDHYWPLIEASDLRARLEPTLLQPVSGGATDTKEATSSAAGGSSAAAAPAHR